MSDQAVLAAAKKNYKAFEKDLGKEVEAKMKTTLAGFMTHLEKTKFEED